MLNNTLYRIKHDKALTVGFFGGSITEGAGASCSANCWRGSIMTWLRETYPDCAFTEIQAAIGGTGSSLGIFRCQRDLLDKKPDLVFMEYSVNDGGGGNYDEITVNSETILRKIWTADPTTEVIYVHTTTKSIADRIAAGLEYVSRAAHSRVMHYYGVQQIDVGEILRSRVLCEGTDGGEADWKKYTTDTVHPNDSGYAIYTEAIRKLLEAELAGEPSALIPTAMPSPLVCESRQTARLDDCTEKAYEGWECVEKSLCGRYPRYIEATVPGTELTYTFEGRCVGVYAMLAKDSGDFIWSVDGGEEKTHRTWDSYCPRFNRAGGMILAAGLEAGTHTLKIRVAESKAEESEGTAIRIGAFMVY